LRRQKVVGNADVKESVTIDVPDFSLKSSFGDGGRFSRLLSNLFGHYALDKATFTLIGNALNRN
jgi:hypothetical protein